MKGNIVLLDYFDPKVQQQQNIVLKQRPDKDNIWYIYECDEKHIPNKKPSRVLKFFPLTESNLELTQLYLNLQEVKNPNIAKIYEVERVGNQFCLEIEYVDGDTIDELLEEYYASYRGPMSVKACIEIATQVCNGLLAFHDAGYTHKDISCNNVMVYLDKNTGMMKAKIIDFENGHKTDTSKARDTTFIGTPGYAAPEQMGYSATDPSTDVYAVGKLMCRMLADSEDERVVNNISDEVLRRIIKKCIRKDKEERYQDIRFLIADLNRYYEQKFIPRSHNSNVVVATFQEYMEDEFGENYKSIFLEKPESIKIPINVVIGFTLIGLVILGIFVPSFAMVLLILGYYPYSVLVGVYFKYKLHKMEYYYPYAQELYDIKDKLCYDLLKSGIKVVELSDDQLVLKIKKREYTVKLDIKSQVIRIYQTEGKRGLRNVFRMMEDIGNIVFMIQHVNSF